MEYTMMKYIFFIQNKKLIAINNNNKSGRRGAKVPDSTTNGGKSYPPSTSRRDFPNDPNGYVYGGKSKKVIKNTPILR